MLAGQQFERAVRRAMAVADVRSVSELARESRVQRDTLYAWFRGERPPKPDTLKRVADRLGVRVGELWNYEPVDDWLAAVRQAVAEGVEEGVRRAVERLADGGTPPRLPRPPRPGSQRTPRASVTPIRGGVEIELE